jgi:hypothetical protein
MCAASGISASVLAESAACSFLARLTGSDISRPPCRIRTGPAQYLVPVIEAIQAPDVKGRARVRHGPAQRAVGRIRPGERGFIPCDLGAHSLPGLVVGGCFTLLPVVWVGGRGRQDQAADHAWVLIHEAHGYAAAVGEAQHVRLRFAVMADERGDVVSEEVGLQRGDCEIADGLSP